ncbi:MAG: energy-coupling factor transporter transmembrane component T [Clostridia bacterium]|nr:energy-coupling factor transporter transmembrane component T [Clostridia bacterium]
MNRDITFGQYYPADSFVHKMDPRVKLILVVAFIVAVFLVKSLFSYIAITIFVIVGILGSHVPIKSILKSVRGIIFVVLLTAILNVFFYSGGERVLVHWWKITITVESLLFALRMALRLIFLVLGTTLLTLTTTPMNLTDGMESLMAPLKLIRFPIHDVAIIMSIALRFIPILMEEVNKIMLAQKARGADFESGGLMKRARALLPVLIPLFVSAFRRADELALALDARCYNATPHRTKYKVLKLGWRDAAGAFYSALLIFAVVAINASFWGLFGFSLSV